MIEQIGVILNWTAAAIVFPLMFLPLAGMLGGAARGSIAFLILALATVGAGHVFALLAPDLNAPAGVRLYLFYAGAVLALSIIVGLVGGPRRAAAALLAPLSFVTRASGRVVMWFVLLMALTQFAVVIFRYVFGVSFMVMQEGVMYFHGAVFLLAAGYALLTNDHVRVDIFYRNASPMRKALTDFVGVYLLLFPTSLLIFWTASTYVGSSWAVREGSNEQSGIQALFILKSFIPAFAVLIAAAGFCVAARAGEVLRAER